jgi:hypothetical protein
MSILNITPEDFESAPICIATNKHTEDGLQEYIDKFEVDYLQDLLGCELYDLFVADLLNGVPQTQIYIDIYEPFCKDDNCGRWRSEGIVKMVEKFIFWKYTRDQKVKNTNTGNIVNSNEVSREAEFSESRIYTVYNEGICSYDAIQWYICDNLTDYPTFKGIIKKKTSWL